MTTPTAAPRLLESGHSERMPRVERDIGIMPPGSVRDLLG